MPAHLSAPDHEPMDDDPVLYQIRVNGHLGPILLSAFPALVSQQHGAETVLTGLLPDAAALYGVLAEIEALGLDLLEVRKVRPRRQEDPGCAE
jgi:monoterpene epsilon-lactone hydrolase